MFLKNNWSTEECDRIDLQTIDYVDLTAAVVSSAHTGQVMASCPTGTSWETTPVISDRRLSW